MPCFKKGEINAPCACDLLKRFQDMQMLRHTKTLGIIEVEPTVWRNLTDVEKAEIGRICDEKLEEYYKRIKK